VNLQDLGFDNWFEQQADPLCNGEFTLARITTVDRDQYTIISDIVTELPAKLAGHLMHTAASPMNLPCVGDWVCVSYHDENRYAIIHSLVPRKSYLRRKSPGKDIDFQMIAANIDVAFIIQSCHYDFNLRRLERYLVMVNDGHITPVIILTKIDLISKLELDQLINSIRSAGIQCNIIPISNISNEGITDVSESMQAKKTYCLIGSSGVGKTTFINQFLDENKLDTKSVSETGEGRHTTVRRQLLILNQGSIVIDTPGMRELGIMSSSESIDSSFSDIPTLATQCRFKDCSHQNEPGCAIIAAIKNGDLDEKHYLNFVKLKKESEFYDMSYSEKRKKDKELGKFYRSVLKHKKNKK